MKVLKSLVNLIRKISGQQKLEKELQLLRRQADELRYAQLLHDATIDSEWYKYKNLSLGPAAIDYGTAYVIYRVLNQMHPHSILEFGLGQSSKIIHQYASYFNTTAVTYEHDESWIRFFNNDINGLYNVNIKRLDLEEVEIKGCNSMSYKNLQSDLQGKRYDFIFVDGPLGYDPNNFNFYSYSRPQILDICKNNLLDSFCIMIHDSERQGEQNTIDQVCQILKDNHVEYHLKEYSAAKNCFMICSKDMYFLTTL